jgi:beta-glucanase (GH16 family)
MTSGSNNRRRVKLNSAVLGSFAALVAITEAFAGNSTNPPAPAGWRLVWSDEFSRPDGSAPDAAKWGYDTGGGGWGNHELESYTTNTDNARIEDGKLVIEARRENFDNRHYTSARLLTDKTFTQTYGRFEARIKIPRGQGIWPAFWLLGTNFASINWPACGEIDIMENIGNEPGTVHGTVHGPAYSGGKGIGGPVVLPNGAAVADDFHVFAVACEPERITWFMGEKQYF